MKYKIVRAREDYLEDCLKAIESKVHYLLLEGWRLQGGVSIATEKHGYEVTYIACQAMIKE